MDHLDWKSHLADWPMQLVEFDLDPASTALVVVDMQRYGCAPPTGHAGLNSTLAEKRPEMARHWFSSLQGTVIPNIARLIAFFRDAGLPIVYFTLGVERPDGRDASPVLGLRRAFVGTDGSVTRRKGTPEHAVIAALEPREGDLVFNKTTMSGFASTGCDQVFRHMGLQHLVFTGVGTDACVFGTARDAADRGYYSIMVEDACTAQHPLLHEAAMLLFRVNAGRVASTAEVLDELRGDRPRHA